MSYLLVSSLGKILTQYYYVLNFSFIDENSHSGFLFTDVMIWEKCKNIKSNNWLNEQ